MRNEFFLNSIFDRRKSFYNKARVRIEDNGDLTLISYTTAVMKYIKETGEIISNGHYSQTTSRHQQEFRKQIEAGYIG